jgi:hypothetical protein
VGLIVSMVSNGRRGSGLKPHLICHSDLGTYLPKACDTVWNRSSTVLWKDGDTKPVFKCRAKLTLLACNKDGPK